MPKGHNGGFNPYRDQNGEYAIPERHGRPGRSRVRVPGVSALAENPVQRLTQQAKLLSSQVTSAQKERRNAARAYVKNPTAASLSSLNQFEAALAEAKLQASDARGALRQATKKPTTRRK